MDPEKTTNKEKSEDQIKEWVQEIGQQFRSADWIRQRYYENFALKQQQESSNLEKQQTVDKEQVSLNIFASRSADDIRQRYINKLIKLGIMKEGPSKKYQHLFIFDWDDTLLCTSYLSALHFLDLSPEIKELLKKLDDVCTKLIQLTTERGEVYIITNATKGWVEYSSKLYLPKISAILEQKPITIISARTVYGEEYPGDYGRWKIEAFKSILNKINTDLLTNMICMGDSNIEIEAAHCLGKQFEKAVVKTVKFRENPRPDEMVKQLNLVVDKFLQIFNSNKNLTIRLERKK